jgi:hypothetical protein
VKRLYGTRAAGQVSLTDLAHGGCSGVLGNRRPALPQHSGSEQDELLRPADWLVF